MMLLLLATDAEVNALQTNCVEQSTGRQQAPDEVSSAIHSCLSMSLMWCPPTQYSSDCSRFVDASLGVSATACWKYNQLAAYKYRLRKKRATLEMHFHCHSRERDSLKPFWPYKRVSSTRALLAAVQRAELLHCRNRLFARRQGQKVAVDNVLRSIESEPFMEFFFL